jgi:hypothetical protein
MHYMMNTHSVSLIVHTAFWAAALLLLTSCQERATSVTPEIDARNLSGTYRYIGYDINRRQVVSGEIQLRMVQDSIIGVRSLSANPPDGGSPFEVGTGAIKGTIDTAGVIRLFVENQIGFLAGSFDNGRLAGERVFSGLTVPPSSFSFGFFEAQKIANQ